MPYNDARHGPNAPHSAKSLLIVSECNKITLGFIVNDLRIVVLELFAKIENYSGVFGKKGATRSFSKQ